MSFTIGKVRQVADGLTGNISTRANTSRTNATRGLLVTSLVTLLLLLLVLLIFTMVARSLTRPLRKLVSAGFSSLAAPKCRAARMKGVMKLPRDPLLRRSPSMTGLTCVRPGRDACGVVGEWPR
jgi:hypothetical protein